MPLSHCKCEETWGGKHSTKLDELPAGKRRARGLTFTTSAGVSVVTKLDSQLDDNPHTNGDQAGASNLGHDLLQVGNIVGGANQGSSTTKEGVGTSGVHNGVLLSLLDGGPRETHIVCVLLHWQ